MAKKWLWVLVTLIVAAIAMYVGPKILPPGDLGGHGPTQNQIPFFIAIDIINVLAFGFGVAFLSFGWSWFRKWNQSTGFKAVTFIALAWMFVSWWPHQLSHMHYGESMGPLLVIEYVFHVTMMASAAIVLYAMYTFLES